MKTNMALKVCSLELGFIYTESNDILKKNKTRNVALKISNIFLKNVK